MSMLSKAPILVTGAEGFIGSALCDGLLRRGISVRAASRYAMYDLPHPSMQPMAMGTLTPETDWREALQHCSVVVHTAGRAHVMRETAADPLAEFRRINVDCTLALARQALEAGVRRFIYISSAKVLGEGSATAYTDASHPAPKDAYAISKWEAEQGLRTLTAGSTMELVTLRPPMVYGPGVQANFLALLKLIDHGWPLPLQRIANKRSLIYIENLIDAIITCISHTEAAHRWFLVADAAPVSTPGLVRAIAGALGRPARLFPFPAAALKHIAALFGKRQSMERLLDSFPIDATGIMHSLNWSPPVTSSAGLKRTADWFKAEFRN
jgi:nucleoside-diphosphate-sugar epimerase